MMRVEACETLPSPEDLPRNQDRRLRVFLAIPTPPVVHAHLRRLTRRLAAEGLKGKFCDPRQAHLTLVFLGERRAPEIECIRDIARRLADETPPFRLIGDGVASFDRHPRLLFLAWRQEPAEAFTRLAVRLRDALASTVGLATNTRRQTPFPHTTLVRFRTPGDARALHGITAERSLDRRVWRWPHWSTPVMHEGMSCTSFSLYHSRLTPAGPVYRELDAFPFPPFPIRSVGKVF